MIFSQKKLQYASFNHNNLPWIDILPLHRLYKDHISLVSFSVSFHSLCCYHILYFYISCKPQNVLLLLLPKHSVILNCFLCNVSCLLTYLPFVFFVLLCIFMLLTRFVFLPFEEVYYFMFLVAGVQWWWVFCLFFVVVVCLFVFLGFGFCLQLSFIYAFT